MKCLIGVSVVLLAVLAQPVVAEQVRVSCSEIADAAERLACFDRTFPSDTRVAPEAVPQTEAAASLDSQAVAPQSSLPVVAPKEAVAAPSANDASGSDTSSNDMSSNDAGNGGPFSSKPKVNISSKLKSVRDADKQKMIFLLENDQIWLQVAPRSLPFSKGQDVTIKSGTVGGYLLSNEEGVSTRVRRIK